jgi:hypothetical protein
MKTIDFYFFKIAIVLELFLKPKKYRFKRQIIWKLSK